MACITPSIPVDRRPARRLKLLGLDAVDHVERYHRASKAQVAHQPEAKHVDASWCVALMTTKAGKNVRCELRKRYRLRRVWDFGDTKLFSAAVLPAVIIAGGRRRNKLNVAFSSIYETSDAARDRAADPIAALALPSGAVVEVRDGRRFRVTHGSFEFNHSRRRCMANIDGEA